MKCETPMRGGTTGLLNDMLVVFLKYCDGFAQGIAEQRSRSNQAGDVIQQ
jgi:hypothetical protein